ncbi:MAG: DUF1847 domain-containing protein [Deltaproteobacteria bacterium]
MKKKEKSRRADCAHCLLTPMDRICMSPGGKSSGGCPTVSGKKISDEARSFYASPAIHEFARQASIQEGECYAGKDQKPFVLHPVKTRIEEICEFAQKMGYVRLGLVFCVGLAREAGIVADMLERRGFEVVSVICKVGAVPKEDIGLKDEEKVRAGRHESMCNPIAQAMIMNDAQVQFNILLGLCVGHDSLFFKYAEAPVTVLAVKDRVTGHNPLAAVYLADSYYVRLK